MAADVISPSDVDTTPQIHWEICLMPKPGIGRARPANPPKPAYGQHFLTNHNILKRELQYAKITREDEVLEVGPGPGNLTELLAQSAGRVHAIEIDPQFKPALSKLESRYSNLAVIWGDSLQMPFPRFNKIVANLPYRPSLPLIFKFLEYDFHTAVLVIQSRLARRLAATSGQEGYSRISVVSQRLASLRILETVKREQFEPPPDVASSMIRIRKTRPSFHISSDEEFSRLLDFLFLHRKWRVHKALMDLRQPAKTTAALSQLPASIANKAVAMVTPPEFGKISLAIQSCNVTIPSVSAELKRKAQKYF